MKSLFLAFFLFFEIWFKKNNSLRVECLNVFYTSIVVANILYGSGIFDLIDLDYYYYPPRRKWIHIQNSFANSAVIE